MACKNCMCDVEPVPVPDKFDEHEKALKMIVGLYEKLNESITNINRFLQSKYPDDLEDFTCTNWANKQDRLAAQEQRIKDMIDELKEKGYLVERIIPAEPTIENAIRDVVLANTVVK